MRIIKYNDIYFFFEDDVEYLCECYLNNYYTPNRFHNFESDNVKEFIKNYYNYYFCGLSTDYDKLFTEEKLIKDITGLKFAIWIDPAGKNRNVSHNEPRLKVYFEGKEYPVLFKTEVKFADEDNVPKELKRELPAIQKFVYHNKRELIAYWYRYFDDFDLLKKKIAKKQVKTGAIDKKVLKRFNLTD